MNDNVPNNRKSRNTRRRKKSKLQIFKETYLPLIIAGASLLIIIIFIVGSITRSIQRSNAEKQAAQNASIAAAEKLERLTIEAQTISDEATKLAASYNYDNAIELIESFSGDICDFPQLERLYQQYIDARSHLVPWDDPSKVLNLNSTPFGITSVSFT